MTKNTITNTKLLILFISFVMSFTFVAAECSEISPSECTDQNSCYTTGNYWYVDACYDACPSGTEDPDNNFVCTDVLSSCLNNVKDGRETDVDCGGTCPACADFKVCSINTDCQSNNCYQNQCVPECYENQINLCVTKTDCVDNLGFDSFGSNTYWYSPAGENCGPGSGPCCFSGSCPQNTVDSNNDYVCETTAQQVPSDTELCNQVTSALPQDQALLSGVLNALSNNPSNKLDAILDIFVALKSWLSS